MQKSEIADSVSLLTGWSAIFDLYSANAEHERTIGLRMEARHYMANAIQREEVKRIQASIL